jgi:hypothetical protein
VFVISTLELQAAAKLGKPEDFPVVAPAAVAAAAVLAVTASRPYFSNTQMLCTAVHPSFFSLISLQPHAGAMKRTAALVLACLLAAAGAASAQDDDKTVDVQHWGGRPIRKPRLPVVSTTRFVATLRGVTSANALMSLTLDTVAQTASYTLAMNDVPGYTMSHIHVVRSLLW